MIDPDDLARICAEYGVAEEQVRRDHLISHVLHALAAIDVPVVFFGGTALARTHLTTAASGGRLSEDIDLYTDDRKGVAAALDAGIPRLLRREFPRSRWQPGSRAFARWTRPNWSRKRDCAYASKSSIWETATRSGSAGRPSAWTSNCATRDVPDPVELRVPTLPAFVAMKVSAYADRRAPRDLYDLGALATLGAVTSEVSSLVRDVTGVAPQQHLFRTLPPMDWEGQLAHQTTGLPSPQQCLATVRKAFATTLGWEAPFDPFAE